MSLRTKMGIILLVATVIPFAMGGAAVQFVVAPAYRAAVSRAAEEHAQRMAEQVAMTIGMDTSRLERLAAWTAIRDLARKGVLTTEQARKLEAEWDRIPLSSEALRPLLHNEVARELRWWRDTDYGVAEILATDAEGRLIAATGKPSDVIQSDEFWWKATYADGEGRVFVSDVHYEESAERNTIDISVPIYEDTAPGSRVVGVVKMAMDAPRMLGSVHQARLAKGSVATVVDREGTILFRSVEERETASPELIELSPDQLRQFRTAPTGSRLFRGTGGMVLTAWSRLQLISRDEPRRYRLPVLYVVTFRSASDAFGPLWSVQFWMLIIGLVTIILAVAVGSWLAEVLVVRQVRTLARGMRELARGDFERAAATAERLIRSDGAGRNGPAKKEPIARR
jgi:hypothetical protein